MSHSRPQVDEQLIIDWTPDRAGVETFSFFARGSTSSPFPKPFAVLTCAQSSYAMKKCARAAFHPLILCLVRLGIKLDNNDYSAIIERVKNPIFQPSMVANDDSVLQTKESLAENSVRSRSPQR
mmetsp:Transcript_14367/g.20675  ORF Transcript_14367/g.20675 Transcript_14367/m.20675 type:complete len:124 (-) Transcript_14367:347-718(-)